MFLLDRSHILLLYHVAFVSRGCGKCLAKQLQEGRACFGSLREAALHHGGEGMAAGAGGSWSCRTVVRKQRDECRCPVPFLLLI